MPTTPRPSILQKLKWPLLIVGAIACFIITQCLQDSNRSDVSASMRLQAERELCPQYKDPDLVKFIVGKCHEGAMQRCASTTKSRRTGAYTSYDRERYLREMRGAVSLHMSAANDAYVKEYQGLRKGR